MSTISELPLNKIKVGKNSRGPLLDKDLGRLTSSIEHQGMLQPVGVYKGKGESLYTLVYGFRRLRAAKILGWPKIPVVIHTRMDVAHGQDLLQNAAENWVRTQPSFPEQAKLFDKLIKLGMTRQDIAKRAGLSTNLVDKCLSTYHGLPKNIVDKVNVSSRAGKAPKGVIPVSVADAVITLARRKKLTKPQVDKLYKYLVKNQPSAEAISTMGSLLDKGMPIDTAIRTSENIRNVSVSIRVHYPKLRRLMKKKGFNNISEFLTSILRRSKDFPVVDL